MNKHIQQSEAELLKSCKDLLSIYETQGKLTFLRLNAGVTIVKASGGRRRAFRGVRKGASDLIIFISGGKTLFVELKVKKRKQSPSQKDYERLVKGLGFEYYVIYSLEELDKIIKQNQNQSKP